MLFASGVPRSKPYVGQLCGLARSLGVQVHELLDAPAAEINIWNRYARVMQEAQVEACHLKGRLEAS